MFRIFIIFITFVISSANYAPGIPTVSLFFAFFPTNTLKIPIFAQCHCRGRVRGTRSLSRSNRLFLFVMLIEGGLESYLIDSLPIEGNKNEFPTIHIRENYAN